MLLHVESNCSPSVLEFISSHARGGSTAGAVKQGEEMLALFINPPQSVAYFSLVHVAFG